MRDKEKAKAWGIRYRAEHAQEIAEYKALYRVEHIEEERARGRRYYAENTDKVKVSMSRSHAKNAEKIKVYMAQWRANHKEEQAAYRVQYDTEHHEEKVKRMRQWRDTHKEEELAYRIQYDTEHRKERREGSKRWKREHPDLAVEYEGRRRALKKNAPNNDLTAAQWQERKCEYSNHCAYCLKPITGSIAQEHMTPLSRGGPNTLSNVVPACVSCNSKKWTKTLLEYVISTKGIW